MKKESVPDKRSDPGAPMGRVAATRRDPAVLPEMG
jgi:hypothetical protein